MDTGWRTGSLGRLPVALVFNGAYFGGPTHGTCMIIREGHNCWRRTQADKAAFLIDAAAYFDAFVHAVRHARQTVYIAGWDFDSRLALDPRGRFPEPIPSLGAFLNGMVSRNKSLQTYVLSWDYAMIYLRERQWMPVVNFGWKSHRRIHFHLDDQHPLGASHHQKFVVIDDQIAFCGGLDLTGNRWDTPAHHPDDPHRSTPNGTLYSPFHDIQMAVGGETAQALGEMFRQRWRRAVGVDLPTPQPSPRVEWPQAIPVDMTACPVAIARTLPAYKDQAAVREVERIYQDAIDQAQTLLYIENQYLTADCICKRLAPRLQEENGPEIVIVMPSKADGWLEQSTMDAIRRRCLASLAEADRHGRLSVYWPAVGARTLPVYVHSKILIADDRLAIVGSANLSNRSMGLDTECCLVVEDAGDSDVGPALRRFRLDLLAEHLGASVQEVAAACEREGSIRGAIRKICGAARCLKPLDLDAAPVVDGTAWVPDASFLDPEEPFHFDKVIDHFARAPEPQSSRGQFVKIAVMILVLLGLAAVWRLTPLADWLTIERLAQWAGVVDDRRVLMAVVVGTYVVASLIFVPVTLLVGATALILPPWQSFVCAMTGTVLSAWATYWVGRRLGKRTVRKVAGERLTRLNKYLARQGVLTVMIVRNLPVAPFTVVNIVAGTTRIKQGAYLLGTLLGMLPGILVITIFTDRMLQVFKNPSWINVLTAAGVLLVIGFGLWWLRKRLMHKFSS